MKNTEKWSATEYPEEIAGALVYHLYGTGWNSEKEDEIREDVQKAVEWLKAAAENEKNDNSFRALYTVLENLKNEIEEEIPWWDKE